MSCAPAPTFDQPCASWVTPEEIVARVSCPCLEGMAADAVAFWALIATTYLWRQTGRQYGGQCAETLRPIPRCACHFGTAYARAGGYFVDSRGVWPNWMPGSVWWACDRGAASEGAHDIDLGRYPVVSVESVVINGAVLDSSAYRIDDYRWLVRTDGDRWPTSQRWDGESGVGDPDAADTWEVALTYGYGAPPDAQVAAAVLTCELIMSQKGDSGCRLPSKVTQVTRQQMSMMILPPFGSKDEWGIPEIDQFVQSTNPNRLVQAAAVISPDVPRATRRAGTWRA